MTLRIIFYCLFAVLLAGTAAAILPPDARFRTSQIQGEYMRQNQKYLETQKQQAVVAVEQYKKAEAAISTPPWQRIDSQTAGLSGADQAGAANAAKAQKRNHRFLVSVVLLILIGAGVGWARYKTREIDQ